MTNTGMTTTAQVYESLWRALAAAPRAQALCEAAWGRPLAVVAEESPDATTSPPAVGLALLGVAEARELGHDARQGARGWQFLLTVTVPLAVAPPPATAPAATWPTLWQARWDLQGQARAAETPAPLAVLHGLELQSLLALEARAALARQGLALHCREVLTLETPPEHAGDHATAWRQSVARLELIEL